MTKGAWQKQRWLWGIGIVLLCFVMLWFAKIMILPVVLAGLLCYLTLPAVEFLEKRHCPTGISIFLILGAFFCVLVMICIWGIPRLMQEMVEISKEIPVYWQEIKTHLLQFWLKLKQTWGIPALPPRFLELSQTILWEAAANLGRWLQRSLQLLPAFISNLALLVFVPVMAFYFLRDRKVFLKKFNALFPPETRMALAPLGRSLHQVLCNYIKGYLLVAVLVGVCFAILLFLLGVRYALVLGIIMAIAELIPYLGPFFAFFPSVLLVLLQGPQAVIKLLVAWLIAQQLENLVISPKIMSGSVSIHPLLIMVVVLVGGYWFGFLGFLLAVPITAICKEISLWAYQLMLDRQAKKTELKL